MSRKQARFVVKNLIYMTISVSENWRACISFADPMKPIKAEKNVTAYSPARMIGGQNLMAEMMFSFRRREACVMLAANERIPTIYTTSVVSMAQSAPWRLDLLGLRRSLDIEAPAKRLDVAGNRIQNKSCNA